MSNKKDFKEIKKFHGHIGPWVLTGFIIGKLARENLKKLKEIKIEIPFEPPHSCLIDGIQLSSGLTIGRGEIKLKKNNNIKMNINCLNKKIVIKLNKDFSKNIPHYKKLSKERLAHQIINTFNKFF